MRLHASLVLLAVMFAIVVMASSSESDQQDERRGSSAIRMGLHLGAIVGALYYGSTNMPPIHEPHHLRANLTRSEDSISRHGYYAVGDPRLCNKGYCWAWCNGAGLGVFDEWCYTTRGSSQDHHYVGCNGGHNDCDPGWRCAGACGV